MAGLIQEAAELLEEEKNADPTALDAALIVAAPKVKHYEIAACGSARPFARTLGATEIAKLLQQTETDQEIQSEAERD